MAPCIGQLNFHRAIQRIVLQAVIGDDHVNLGVGSQQTARCRHPVTTYKHRHLTFASNQQRFVTGLCSGHVGFHLDNSARLSTITTRNHAGRVALRAQHRYQPDHQRRLASATDKNIPDHDHRHRQSRRRKNTQPVENSTEKNNQKKNRRKRQEQAGDESAMSPGLRQQVCKQGRFCSGIGHQRDFDCAENVTCGSPARRAASITLITD